MIKITNKNLCCGCSACVQICPKHCIRMNDDKEGFLYPEVEESSCVNCGLCEKVCPFVNQTDEARPLEVYAVKHPDDAVRMNSSSGGVFTLLAEQVIDEGGVVFGARFNDEWDVIHDYAETKDGLMSFRGSKYVQSNVADSYKQVEAFLKADRKVMFVGTPCQVAGLKKYLRLEYEKLLTVDFICHGVPSPKVWKRYLQEKVAFKGIDDPIVTAISFRNKSTGWKKYSLSLNVSDGKNHHVYSSVFTDNEYMRAFLSDLSIRPSCYNCPAKSGKSGSDVTIGDFWGIEKILPELDDDKGLSIVLLNNNYREYVTEQLSGVRKVDFQESIQGNKSYGFSVKRPINRDYFFHCIQKGYKVSDAVSACESMNVISRMRRLLYRRLGV